MLNADLKNFDYSFISSGHCSSDIIGIDAIGHKYPYVVFASLCCFQQVIKYCEYVDTFYTYYVLTSRILTHHLLVVAIAVAIKSVLTRSDTGIRTLPSLHCAVFDREWLQHLISANGLL